jgi:hypothetical protein
MIDMIMEQKIEKLSAEDTLRIEQQRLWAQNFFDTARASYATANDKLELMDRILKSRAIRSCETWKLQSLGIALGDALVQKMGLMWVAVEDQFGRDPATCVPGTAIFLFPLTMIS